MKHTNINKTAMSLAWLLLKTNKVLTSKAKGFNYFLTIAYKMLKNNAHFIHVLKGLSAINKEMVTNRAISITRSNDFGNCYADLRILAGYELCKEVKW